MGMLTRAVSSTLSVYPPPWHKANHYELFRDFENAVELPLYRLNEVVTVLLSISCLLLAQPTGPVSTARSP